MAGLFDISQGLTQQPHNIIYYINDVILTPVRRQSAASVSVLLRLVPRANEMMFASPGTAFEKFHHMLSNDVIFASMRRKSAASSPILPSVVTDLFTF